MTLSGRISDLFFSYQGEGTYLGEPQIFLRLAGCNMRPRCLYCDTDLSANWEMTAAGVLERIDREKWPAQFISITGGEPLIQIDFLKVLLPLLKRKGFRIYLETNGTLPESLARIIDNVDVIAMDIKLPSSGKTCALWGSHARFLNEAKEKEILVKVILTRDTQTDDFHKAVDLARESPSLTFILQPATPGKKTGGIGDRKIKEFYSIARQKLKSVRVVPQAHAILSFK